MAFDNEDELDTNTDEKEGSPSETPSSEDSDNEGDAKAASSEQEQDTAKEKETPFHQHPRWIERDNELKEERAARKALEERYSQMEARMTQLSQTPKETASKDELIEHLRTIDPKFAERMEKLTQALPSVEAMQRELQGYKQAQVQSQAVSKVNGLHESNKVSAEMRQFINNEIDRRYVTGELKNLGQIENTYKEIHDVYTKFVDGIKRAERESYVPAKKADSKVPTSQPKGKPVSRSNTKPEFSKDPEIAKQQIVARYLKQSKAEADL